jgi:hypothetical protein
MAPEALSIESLGMLRQTARAGRSCERGAEWLEAWPASFGLTASGPSLTAGRLISSSNQMA